jgi:hypothetical protein
MAGVANNTIINDEIKKSLLANGWQNADIEEVFGESQTSDGYEALKNIAKTHD